MEISKPNTTISHSNTFIEGVFDMNLIELRIFLSLLAKHKRGHNVFKEPVRLTLTDLDIPITKGTFSRQLKKSTDRLSDIKFKYENADTYAPLHIFTPVMDKKKKTIEVKLSLEIQELVNIWTNNFTEADVTTLMTIPTFTSYRIYMLLKQYQTWKTEREISLEKLREMLAITEQKSYEVYGNLKNRILKPAKEHLKGTDMEFDFTEIKSGKAVRAIRFTFDKVDRVKLDKKKDQPKPEQQSLFTDTDDVLTKNAIRILKDNYQFDDKQIAHYISKLQPLDITKANKWFQENQKTLTYTSKTDWFAARLDNLIKKR